MIGSCSLTLSYESLPYSGCAMTFVRKAGILVVVVFTFFASVTALRVPDSLSKFKVVSIFWQLKKLKCYSYLQSFKTACSNLSLQYY